MVAKYDPIVELVIRQWIHELTGVEIAAGPDNMCSSLRDGMVLIQ